MSTYDRAAPCFERHRTIPPCIPETIRTVALQCIGRSSRPRLLDLGAGTGRIGRAFIAAGDDYVGLDLSFGMLREFKHRHQLHAAGMPRLVQANGESMPFRDATFDAVLMIQVVGALHGWRPLADEARRVLRPSGSLMLGRVIAPVNGIDARMRERLTSLLATMDVRSRTTNARDEARRWLEGAARSHERIIAATWSVEHTPGAFIERHRTGARFSALPTPVQSQALRGLAAWASAAFGSLDSVSSEPREFELLVYKFDVGTDRKCGT